MGKSSGSPKITPVSTLTGGESKLLNQLTGLLSGQVGNAVMPYTGQRTAGVSPLQMTGFNLAGSLSPGIGKGLDLFSETLSGYSPQQGFNLFPEAVATLRGGTQAFDPSTIMDALQPAKQLALNTFQDDIVPYIMERYGANASSSGAMNKELARQGSNLSLGLGQMAAPYLFQGQQSAQDRMLTGAGMFGNLAQLPGQLATQGANLGGMSTDLLGQLMNMGTLQRGIGQEGLTAEQQRWMESQSYNNPWLNMVPTALGVRGLENIVQPAPEGLMSSLLPGLGAYFGKQGVTGGMQDIMGGLGGLAAFFCDERLKEDIAEIPSPCAKIAKVRGCTFKFKGSDKRSGGVIAQELEKVLPEAIEDVGGIKMVRVDAIVGLLVGAVGELHERLSKLEN